MLRFSISLNFSISRCYYMCSLSLCFALLTKYCHIKWQSQIQVEQIQIHSSNMALSLGISVSFANTSVFSGVFDSRNRLYLFVVGVYERSWLLFALDVSVVGTIAHTMANIFIPSSVQWIAVKIFSTCGRLSQRTVDQMIIFCGQN